MSILIWKKTGVMDELYHLVTDEWPEGEEYCVVNREASKIMMKWGISIKYNQGGNIHESEGDV